MQQGRVVEYGYCGILGALLKKNLLVVKASAGRYALIYLSPLVILLLMILLQMWTDESFQWERPHPPIEAFPTIPKCTGTNCTTIAYTVFGEDQPYIHSTMQYVMAQNNLSQADIAEWKMQPNMVMDYLNRFPNKTQSVIIFCTSAEWVINDVSVPCYAEEYHLNTYTIVFNLSLFHRVPFFSDLRMPYPKDLTTVKLKKDIDEGIMKYYSPSVETNLTLTSFPNKTSRFLNGLSIAGQYGSFFIMIPFLILLVHEGSQLLKNKQNHLRIGLNIVGVTHLQFYLSEIITYFAHVFVLTTMFCLFGWLLGMKFFSEGIMWFDFSVLLLNGFIIGFIAFCVTAGVNNKSLGMSVLYGFVLYSIIMQWLFTGGIILELLYMNTANQVVKILKFVFNLYPSFHFSKIFSDLSRIVDNHLDTFQNRYVDGRTLQLADLFKEKSQTYTQPIPHSYTLPSPFESFIYLALTSLLYLTILALLDRCVQSNRGYTEPLCANLRKRKKSIYGQLEEEDEEDPLVQIVNLQKTYGNNVFAVRGVSMALQKGEIVGLLGQNGAGKSTLINILIGALSMTKGEVIIDGKDITSDIREIRKVLGVCPQFDILWEELTAHQHMELFCKLKGYDNSLIRSGLESVNLWANKDGQVKTFSGGMKRRLSLAISLLGDPKLIILDQPTTGMDAKIRLSTWKIILQLRGKKTVLITTHNMEEAEVVSDKILIMSKGKIVARGTTIQLKNQYGGGYVIRGFDRKTKEEVIIRCKDDELEEGIKSIYERNLENWSLQETTLEQVFLNVNSRY